MLKMWGQPLWLSLARCLALSGSLSSPLRLSLVLSGSLWLSMALRICLQDPCSARRVAAALKPFNQLWPSPSPSPSATLITSPLKIALLHPLESLSFKIIIVVPPLIIWLHNYCSSVLPSLEIITITTTLIIAILIIPIITITVTITIIIYI